MSGLLHRLASQVVGPPPLTARARSLPRFAPSQDAQPTTGLEAVPACAPASQAQGAPASDSHSRPSASGTNRQLTESGTHSRLSPSGTSLPAATVPPSDPAMSKTRGDVIESHDLYDTTTVPPLNPKMPSALVPQTVVRKETSPAPGAPAQPARSAPTSGATLRPESIASETAPQPLFAPASVDTLLPSSADGSVSLHPAGRPAGGRLNELREVDPAPNEVHVHIGRIEVTAMHEAPPAKPRERGRQPMSLDEYLARRHGERR